MEKISSTTPAGLQIQMLSPDTWSVFETLFEKHKGCGGCWCTYNLCPISRFNRMTRDERKTFQRDLVSRNLSPGLLVLDGDSAVGWCQFGLAECFPRFDRIRAYQTLAIPPELVPSWRISCFLVDKDHRGEGISVLALDAALAHIQQHGGGIVEAFPIDLPGSSKPQYTGSASMFRKRGFEAVARLGTRILLMRLRVSSNTVPVVHRRDTGMIGGKGRS